MTDYTKIVLKRRKKLLRPREPEPCFEVIPDAATLSIYDAILSINDATLIIYDGVRDEQGEIRDWIVRDANEEALREMGLPVDGLVNQLATKLIAAGSPLIPNMGVLHEVTATAKTYRFELHFPWNGKCFLISIFSLGGQTLVTTAKEITKLKQAERFKQSLDNIKTLFNSALDFEEMMGNLLSEAGQAMGTDIATITLIENERWVTRYGYGVPQGMIGWALDIEEARGAENARRTKRPVIVNNTAIDIRTNPKKAKEFHYGSCIIYPLIRKEEVIGIINFVNTSPGTFSDAQLDFVENIALPLSLTIGNAHLFASMQREISEHKRAEDVWRENGKLLGAVLQQMPIGVIIAEAPSGKMILGNHQVERIWRHPFLESTNIGEYSVFYKGFHEDGRAYDSEEWPLARAITKGETVVGEEISLLRGDGTQGTMLFSSIPVKDDAGQIVAGVMIFYSITERKQLEKALWETALEAEQRASELDAVIAAIPDGLIIHDKNGKIKFMNGFAHNTLVSSDNSPELPLPERIRVAELTTVQGKALIPGETPTDRVLNGEIIGNLELVINKDPEHPMQVLVTCAPIRGRNGEITGTVTTFIDITARKRAETALRESREDLNRAQAVAHTGSWRLNVQQNELLWSDEVYRMFGIPAGTPLTYEIFLSIVHPDDRELVDQKWMAALRGEYYDIEHRIVVADMIKWVHEKAELEFDSQGTLQGGFGTVQDITERKRMEEELQVSEENYRRMIETANEGIIIGEPNGKIRFVNPKMVEMLGYSKEELVGRVGLELMDMDQEGIVLKTRMELVEGRRIQREFKFRRKDGSYLWTIASSSPLLDNQGYYLGNLAMHTDITERKRIEEENRSLAKFPSENPNPVLRLNREGIILFANEASKALLQMWNCTIGSVVPKYLVQMIAKTFTRSSEITIDIECNKLIYSLAFVPVMELNYVNIYGSDITERKQTEEELRKSQTLLKSIIDSSPNLIFIKDQQSRMVMANPSTLALIGKPIEQVIGKDDSEHYEVPEIGLAILENDRRIMESGQTETVEETVRMAGEKRIFLSTKTPWRDSEGQVIGVLGISQDITERKELEENLKLLLKSSRQHVSEIDAMLEAIPHAVYFGNEDGITRCNAEALSLLGASSFQDLQQRIGELRAKFRVRYQRDGGLVEPENLPFNRSLKGEVVSLDTWATKADSGEDVLIRSNSAPVMIDGQIFGAVAIEIDITDQYLIQQAFRESEEKMRAIYEQAGVGINQVGLDGRYIEVNHKFQEMTGYFKEEILNFTIYDLYHPDDCKRDEEYIPKILAGEISTYTDVMRLIRKDGSLFWIILTVSLVRKGGQPAYFIRIIEDFSEHKQMEQDLQVKQEELFAANEELQAQQEELTSANEELKAQQEELIFANEEMQAQQEELITINQELQAHTDLLNATFQELQCQSAKIQEYADAEARARDIAERRAVELDATISSIAAGIIIYDDLGNIFRMNEFARSLMGYSSDDYSESYMDHGTGLNLCKSDGTAYVAEETPLYRALRGEIVRDEELMIAKIPDQPIWLLGTIGPILNNNQTIIGVIFVFTDITERKRKTEDLLASERELLKVTLNSLGEGVVATDPEEHIMLINQAALNLTGYSENEVIGEPFHKILYVLDNKTSEPIVVKASRKISDGLMLVTRDLREVPIAMNSSPIKAVDGRIIGTVTIFQDISEKQKTDRELLKADKLESLGILAGGIAHDFNNILAAILSNIQLALRKLEKNEDIQKYLSNTVETTRKASDLTKQLLTFSRGGAPVKKDASLIELIRDTAEFVLRGAKTKAEFVIPDALWAASIDEGQISQVIHNLVLNAKQAMPKGGIINISAENITIGQDVRERVRFNPGNYVKITVIDQGVGIAKEHLTKIFDPYFTTKKDGNGLGLATSYSIISQHNGYLEVESQENAGTTFFIYLPASNTPVMLAESENEIAATGVGLKILFMDDEKKILQAVGEMLNDCFGYQVVLTTDGVGAIELYKKAQASGEPFDAVIMDLTVPGGMGGQEAITYLRDIDPKVKAIVSSGYANDPIMADYERYGFCGVVSKPYKINELNGVLYKVLSTSKCKE